MTHLATHDLEPNLLDELATIADTWTPLGKPFADRFRAACEAEAAVDGSFLGDNPAGTHGYINPNRVRARLMADGPITNPRQLSALWSSSWLTKTDRLVQISGEGSKGNGNKSVAYRRLASP
jgi:hypothetical protein